MSERAYVFLQALSFSDLGNVCPSALMFFLESACFFSHFRNVALMFFLERACFFCGPWKCLSECAYVFLGERLFFLTLQKRCA